VHPHGVAKDQFAENIWLSRLPLQSSAFSSAYLNVQTVRNRLHASGLHARKPAVRPALTARHRNCRLQFARRHANWGVRRIRPVLLTDESRFRTPDAARNSLFNVTADDIRFRFASKAIRRS
jgi:hypothetical protein